MKVTVIGPLSPPISGPGVKNDMLKKTLIKKGVECDIIKTNNWGKRILKLLYKILFKANDKIILAVSRKGRYILSPVLFFLKKIRKNFRYVILPMGGTLDKDIDNLPIFFKKIFKLSLDSSDFIFVETKKLKEKLVKKGFENIKYLPNFKDIEIHKPNTNLNHGKKNVVFISKIKKSKGVKLLIKAVELINKCEEYDISLSFYGPIKNDYKSEFDKLISKNKKISYKGVLDPEKVTEKINQFDIFVFPTYWEGEGFPGILVDALCASVPIVCSDWKYNSEIIEDGKNGLLFESKNINDLKNKIVELLEDKNLRIKIAKNNTKEAKKYLADNVINKLLDYLENKGWVLNE